MAAERFQHYYVTFVPANESGVYRIDFLLGKLYRAVRRQVKLHHIPNRRHVPIRAFSMLISVLFTQDRTALHSRKNGVDINSNFAMISPSENGETWNHAEFWRL